MLFLEVIVALAVLFAVGAVVAVRRRELAPAGRDAPDTRVPPTTTSMTPNDVDGLRFGLAFRGYRMDQVDDALDRLRDELQLRDEQLAALTAGTSAARSRSRKVKQPIEPAPTPVEPAAAGERAPDEPPVEEPVVEEPVVAEPVAEEPAAEEPAEEPAADEPAADEVVAAAAVTSHEPTATADEAPDEVAAEAPDGEVDAEAPSPTPEEPDEAPVPVPAAPPAADVAAVDGGDGEPDDSDADRLSKLRHGRHRREH